MSQEKNALQAKAKLQSSFMKKGITVAILSGMCYGMYSAFLYVGTSNGIWADWYSGAIVLPAAAVVYLLGSMGSAINDTISGIWCMIIAAIKGKLGDYFRTLGTKPGRIMILAALVGGPVASTAYVVAFKMAGSIIIPITALCPAIGAILGRILYKQPLNGRMILGIIICISSSILIGSQGLGADGGKNIILGCLIALIAAFGWGFEGCVAGHGTMLIDFEIGITIRQLTSGLSNLIILVPIFGLITGVGAGGAFGLVGDAIASKAIIFFVISGFFAVYAYSLWYKGNSMCGAALGMACNGMYSFWGPLFTWLVAGLYFEIPGLNLAARSWIGAVTMAIGIFIIAMNPLDIFKKKEA